MLSAENEEADAEESKNGETLHETTLYIDKLQMKYR